MTFDNILQHRITNNHITSHYMLRPHHSNLHYHTFDSPRPRRSRLVSVVRSLFDSVPLRFRRQVGVVLLPSWWLRVLFWYDWGRGGVVRCRRWRGRALYYGERRWFWIFGLIGSFWPGRRLPGNAGASCPLWHDSRRYLFWCLVRHLEISEDKVTHFVTEVKTRQDKKRQEKTREDKTRQDKTRQDKTRLDKTRQDKTRQVKTSQD